MWWSGRVLAQDCCRVIVEDSAIAADQHVIMLLDLPLPPLPTCLHHRLGERREPLHVVGR